MVAALTREQNTRRTAIATIIGSMVEYYDFTLFGLASALIFGPLFFPGNDPVTGQLLSFGTFALGFFARPFGGIIFSHFGDRIGRKPMLVMTLVLMGTATILIGCLPTYAAIGVAAPILLVACRLLQGLGAGAEYVGSLVMLAENGDKRRLGLRVALPGMGVFIGIVIATAVFALISLMPEDDMLSWGWRLPFLASIIALAVGLYIRRNINESEEFTAQKATDGLAKFPLVDVFKEQGRQVALGFGINGPYIAFSYIVQVYLLAYLTTGLGMSSTVGLVANLVASIIAIGTTPLFGYLGDLLGRRRIWLFGCGTFVIFGVIAFPLFGSKDPTVIVLTMILGIGIGLASMYATQGAILTELFETKHRLSGVVIVRETTAALIGGPAASVSVWLVSLAGGHPWPIAAVLIGFALIAAVTSMFLPRRAIAGGEELTRITAASGSDPRPYAPAQN